MRIAVGGIHTECSTYNPLIQKSEDFAIREGADLIAASGLHFAPDVEPVPLFHASSLPGGPVSAQTYAAFRKEFVHRLQTAGPFDGVLLLMHGAMHVQGLEDAEGDWISAVRARIGEATPLAVSYDLHGNVTGRIIDSIDIFAAYRTAPHIDVAATHNRALTMLTDALRTRTRYMVGWATVPVLLPGERTSTVDEPARGLYAALPHMQNRPGVSDANLMIGYVWADTPRGTAAAVVTGTEAGDIRSTASEIAQSYWNARNDLSFGVRTADLGTCLDIAASCATGPVILADSGDNPTGGGVGDRSDVLHEVIQRHITGTVFAGITDRPAARAACEAGEGAEVILTIGGSLGSNCPSVIGNVLVERIHGPEGRREVLVSMAGTKIVLTEHRRPFHRLEDFHKLGIDAGTVKLLVVKSGYLSPELAPLARPALMALTDGAVNQDIPRLENLNRVRPSWPFQPEFEWRPRPALSNRASRIP